MWFSIAMAGPNGPDPGRQGETPIRLDANPPAHCQDCVRRSLSLRVFWQDRRYGQVRPASRQLRHHRTASLGHCRGNSPLVRVHRRFLSTCWNLQSRRVAWHDSDVWVLPFRSSLGRSQGLIHRMRLRRHGWNHYRAVGHHVGGTPAHRDRGLCCNDPLNGSRPSRTSCTNT